MDKIKTFWQKYEYKIILAIGFVLVAGLAFQAGYLRGKGSPENPIIVEKSATCPIESSQKPQNAPPAVSNSNSEIVPPPATTPAQNCAFVGSKNSNKYHLPTCQFAKRIKPENIVCFASAEEATGRNYLPDKGCIK